MSINAMLTAATIPVGTPGSLFVNPAASGISDIQTSKSTLNDIFTAIGIQTTPGSPGDISCIDTLCTGVNSHITDKVTSLPTQLPIVSAAASSMQRVNQMDSAMTNSSATSSSDASGCPSLMSAAFATLKSVGGFLADVGTGIYNIVEPVLSPLFGVVGDIVGWAITSAKDMISAIAGASSIIKDSVLGAIGAFVTTATYIVSAVSGAIGSLVSTIGSKISEFASSVATEAAALASGLSHLLNMHLLGSLTSPTPCTKSIHDVVINKAVVDTAAVTAISTGAPTMADIAKTTGYSNQPLPDNINAAPIPDTLSTPSPVTQPSTEMYTQDETTAMFNQLDAAAQASTAANDAATAYVNDFMQWKIDNNYEKIKADAGATLEVPDGTTTDPALKQQWIAIRDIQRTKVSSYNAGLHMDSVEKSNTFKAMHIEYQRRYKYGRHYATNMTAANGTVLPPSEITTLLDSTT